VTARENLINALKEEHHPSYWDDSDARDEEALVAAFEAEVLRDAAARQRRLPITDSFLRGQRDALADLIDPDMACDCGELTCECGCQQGERERHWIHARFCATQKRRR
jgi:hypothetical protein